MTSALWLVSGIGIGVVLRGFRVIRPAPRWYSQVRLRLAWYQRPQSFPPIPPPLRRESIPEEVES
jgi:hypothetical protein